MSKATEIDETLVRKLAALLDETRLTEIEYAWGELRLRVVRQPAPIQALAPAPVTALAATPEAAPAEPDPANHPGAVKSPMVGVLYLAPQPGAAAFVKPGDRVAAGQPLFIIEAMKVMNQIRAPKAGTLARVLVEDAAPVEFGQVVMVLE